MLTAKGEQMSCPGMGHISITNSILMKDVLHCPETTINLLSVSQLCDLGLNVKFTSDKCIVTKSSNGQVVLEGHREGNLYIYKRTIYGESLYSSQKVPNTSLMHRRLGHKREKYLKVLQGFDC
jgi:hypothetical protein